MFLGEAQAHSQALAVGPSLPQSDGFAECTTANSKMVRAATVLGPPFFCKCADSKGVRNTDFLSADCKGLPVEVRGNAQGSESSEGYSSRPEETEDKGVGVDFGRVQVVVVNGLPVVLGCRFSAAW